MLPDPGVIFVDTAAPPESLAADPTRTVVYVTTHFEEARAISTDTGASLWVVSATIVHPDTLVVSDDGSTLYALDIQLGLIDRVITATGRVDLTIALPIDPSGGTRPEIQDLAVVPGSPRTVVVIAGQQETLWALDDDVPRAAVGQANVSYVRMDGPSTIYAVAAGGSFVTFTLAPSGVQAGAAGPVSGLFGPNVGEFLFDGELAFDDKGQVVDPRRGVLLGSYGVTGSVAVDRTGNRSYLAWPTNAPANDLQIVIGEFDRTAFTRLRTLTLSLQSGNALLVRARDGTLAAGGFLQGPQTTNGVALVRPDAWQAATSP